MLAVMVEPVNIDFVVVASATSMQGDFRHFYLQFL
jgi:hypothetical protein